MNVDARVEAWASLQLLTGVSPRSLIALLKAFGGPAEVLAAPRARLCRIVSDETAAIIERGPDDGLRKRTIEWLLQDNHSIVAWDDPDYPQPLLNIAIRLPRFTISAGAAC